jgi:hypothetical protein
MKPETIPLTETAALIANIEPLLLTEIRTAEHHGLDQIRISVPRAKEVHRMAITLEKRIKNILATAAAADNATDRRLNAIFGLN